MNGARSLGRSLVAVVSGCHGPHLTERAPVRWGPWCVTRRSWWPDPRLGCADLVTRRTHGAARPESKARGRGLTTAPVYALRRAVQAALDVKETARAREQIDRALQSASRAIDGLCHRRFYPTLATLTWDWPSVGHPESWVLWLDEHELAAAPTAVSSGGASIALTDVLTRPDWGPPFNRIELNRATVGGFTSGSTPQRSISITGLFGYDANEDAATTLAANASSSVGTITVADASKVGSGSLLKVGSERMVCTDAAMVDSGLTVVGAALTASNAAVTLTASGAGLNVGETVLIDSERMLIVDGVSPVWTVRRATDGSTLAAHTNGTAINALRSLTVERGALGTTAAAHNSADVVYRKVYPGPVVNFTAALAMAELGMEQGGYKHISTRAGSKETLSTVDMSDLADRVFTLYGRKNRMRAV